MSSAEDQKATVAKAKAVVYRLFKFRPRSQGEIIAKLKDKNFDSAIIEQVVFFFKEGGLIEDAAFTKSWVASRLQKPMGMRRIRQELKKKGVADEIISAEFSKIQNSYDELETVNRVAQKRVKVYQGLDQKTITRRLEGYLLRRGFSTEAVYKALGLF